MVEPQGCLSKTKGGGGEKAFSCAAKSVAPVFFTFDCFLGELPGKYESGGRRKNRKQEKSIHSRGFF